MPFVQTTLRDPLETLFAEPPSTAAACAQQWADAVASYFADITPPLALPMQQTAAEAARVALQASLAGTFSAAPQVRETSATQMEAAFVTYGGAIAAAIVLAGLHTAIPPAAPVGFLSLFVSLADEEASHAEAANEYANAIHAWAKTGTTTLILTPFTTLTWNGTPPGA